MPNGMMMANSITLPWLFSISQKPGNHASAVINEPLGGRRARPMHGQAPEEHYEKAHHQRGGHNAGQRLSVRVICTVCVRYEMGHAEHVEEHAVDVARPCPLNTLPG